jgi:hypothetical protein
MIDDAGAASAAAEPLTPSQDADNVVAQPASRDPENAVTDRSQETARASIDRAFAEIDAAHTAQAPEPPKADKPVADKTEKPPSVLTEPPSRFSADAKAAWASVPDAVKGEVNRAFRELEGGLTQYQQIFEPLKPFYQLAEKNETTVQDALGRYVALDSQLTSEDAGKRLSAIREVLEYAGLSPEQYAAQVADQKPGEAQAQSDPEMRQLKSELAEMRRLIGGVSATLRQSRESRLESELGAAVAEFAKDHPRLDEAEFTTTVTRLISNQMADNLESAYDMAERLIPAAVAGAPPAASIAALPPKPADQTRKGQLSIAGAPVSGSNPAHRKPAATARESLDRAFADMGFSG